MSYSICISLSDFSLLDSCLNLLLPLFPQLESGMTVVPVSWCHYEDTNEKVVMTFLAEFLMLRTL